ncbi:GSCOCG00001163001-RA-CDS [Cotesia congregata]|nr:GSCOCG00001163001-RA-CDS [Cotesia congregata]
MIIYSNSIVWEVVHTNQLSENIGSLYLSDDYCDVTLIVGGQRFNGHKLILAARSQYFRALLYGGLRESEQTEIELKETTLPAFKELLKYIYIGHLSLVNQPEETILDILSLAHQYGFVDLEMAISDYLKEILDIKNVCLIFDAARLYQLSRLTKVCYEYMDTHAIDIIKHSSFLQLSAGALNDLISRDSFYAPEIDIFLAVQSWVKANPEVDVNEVLGQVRLSLISITDLLNIVRPTGLVSPEAILDAIAARTNTRDSELNYRGRLIVDENVARPNYEAEVLQGEMRGFLLDGDTLTYDMEQGYSRHVISDLKDHGIVVKLGTPSIINHIKMLLWDRDLRSYSYYIEVSNDQKDWVKIIDYSDYFCRSWHRARNALLNGQTSNYDWDIGYTCHQIGSGVILVQLGQPYIIDSMRLLLWDCDDRSYSYYIEVSGNLRNWERVIDKSEESCRSWQTLRFSPPRNVVFIRIVGTHNTANEVFHCVHFECPAKRSENGEPDNPKSPYRKGKRQSTSQSTNTTASMASSVASELISPEGGFMSLDDPFNNAAAGGAEAGAVGAASLDLLQ